MITTTITTTVTTTIMTTVTDRAARCALLLATASAVTGCGASRSPFAEWIDDEASITAARQAEPRATGGREPVAPRVRPGHVEIFDDAGPEQYVSLALQRNPGVRAAEQAVHRLSDRIPQVTSLDDPMLMVEPIGEMAETAAGRVDVMSSVSQKLPFPGKLQTRGRIAAQAVAEAIQDLERVKLQVAAETRRAWWSLYYTTRAIEVTGQSRDLLAQFRDVAEVKYRAGTATQQDVLRASVEMSKLDDDLISLEQRRTTAAAMLNQLLDRPVDTPLPSPPVREIEPLSLELQTLLAAAAQASPEIAVIHEQIEGHRQRMELARLNRWPDLTLSFSYNLVSDDGLSPVATGEDQWWVGAGINLPIWAGRLDAAEFEAARGILQSVSELDAVNNQVAFRVQDALARVESQQRQALLFRDVIIPQARQAVDASLSGYRSGKLEFLTLVDNWRKLFEFQVIYHLDLSELERSFADLQQAVGRDLDRLGAAESTEGDP